MSWLKRMSRVTAATAVAVVAAAGIASTVQAADEYGVTVGGPIFHTAIGVRRPEIQSEAAAGAPPGAAAAAQRLPAASRRGQPVRGGRFLSRA